MSRSGEWHQILLSQTIGLGEETLERIPNIKSEPNERRLSEREHSPLNGGKEGA
tara:strand:+ start:274 stop:435 length:162 start_codon:yes stop_codon:yes gene_type:complete